MTTPWHTGDNLPDQDNSDQESIEQELIQAIDACRPGTNDLADPQLVKAAKRIAEDRHWETVYQRSQQFDTKVERAMHEVAVPSRLEAQILSRLGLESPAEEPPAARAHQAGKALAATDTYGRRSWLIATVAATVLMILTAGLVTIFWNHDPLTAEWIERDAVGWVELLDRNGWRETQVPAGFRLPPQLTVDQVRWQFLRLDEIGTGVAYDLTIPPGPQATLLVLREESDPQLSTNPPSNPQITQGRLIAAWRGPGVVYVLVLQGKQANLRHYYQRLAQPAMLSAGVADRPRLYRCLPWREKRVPMAGLTLAVVDAPLRGVMAQRQ